ncbi:MAG: ectonucleotide pyrophosphatase/phosphodiesterase [candidate division KSB1 bacterium]|nr:ectonucleotide pyrophosphatase/phosphodiesterase [candidate division KSB1 bacterium]MDZ7367469.1 ectonucleotide pyrophosphatase/phosphodiesterase [candidate division KSB1 bacterium]MDZ7405426.1 ectonucleotide pyrophosphatase/phosphodiesterase [candidate division KSB1 bacterium]
MTKTHRLFVTCLLIVSSLWGCFHGSSQTAPRSHDLKPTVILISLDGFRWDYLDRFEAPVMQRLAHEGVRAKAMIPVFPTKTFPNHYSIVTGLYPAHHGIVANTMYDPEFDARFRLSDREAVRDSRWWGGEPLWVTAEKHQQRSGILFWPGSEAAIMGIRPAYWKVYDNDFPNAARVDTVLSWLDLPAGRRPTFLTLYFSEIDDAGHRHDPISPEVGEAVRRLDSIVGRLVDGLEARGIFERVNLIILSDHGMAAVKPGQVIFLDDYLDLEKVRVVDWNPVLAVRPRTMSEDEIYQALAKAHPHLQVYRKAELPERLRYSQHRRIAPIIGIADEGWKISRRGNQNPAEDFRVTGEHGYDNQLASMHAIFIARGPAFKTGAVVPPFQNIHLYHLICAILNLPPAPNDGNLDSVRVMLR